VEGSIRPLTISAVYIPANFTVKQEHLEEFYNTLNPRFITGGDNNAKHIVWGSRLIPPRVCEVLKTMGKNNLSHLSTSEPTYSPSDWNNQTQLTSASQKVSSKISQ
jgi:hypothetical protein